MCIEWKPSKRDLEWLKNEYKEVSDKRKVSSTKFLKEQKENLVKHGISLKKTAIEGVYDVYLDSVKVSVGSFDIEEVEFKPAKESYGAEYFFKEYKNMFKCFIRKGV